MDIYIKLKLFVFVFLCFFKVSEVSSTENNTSTDIRNTTNVTIILEPYKKIDTTAVGHAKFNNTETPETAIEINKTENVTTERSSEKTENVTKNIVVGTNETNFIPTEAAAKANVTVTDLVNTDTTFTPTETKKFSDVSFVTVAEESTTIPTTVGKRDAREEIDPNNMTSKPRVTKESHWSEDDAIDRFAEEAQTIRITSKVNDQNLLRNQVELDFDHDPFQRLRFKTSVASDGRSLTPNVGYISRVLSNHVYPTKNKDNKYNIDVQKTRFFDDNIIRPTHKIDRIRFHKNFMYDTDKEKDVRQVSINPKKVYSISDLYKPNILGLIEALPSNSRNNLPYTPLNVVPGGYVNYQIPMSPERKIMKKFFRKIFETKSNSPDNSNFASLARKEALVYVAPDNNNRGSKQYNKEMKEALEGSSSLGEDEKEDEHFQKEKCEILKHVYITRSLEKKIANLERLFLKLFGVIMNGGTRFSKETISIPKPSIDKQYYYLVSGNNPQKRSLQLLAEKPSKMLNFVKVNCDKRGNCGLKRFRKSVTNETSIIHKEDHTTFDTKDVSKILDDLLNATNEAMNKFNSTRLYEESDTSNDKEIKAVHVTVDKNIKENKTVISKKEAIKPVKKAQRVAQVQQVPEVQEDTQREYDPGQIGNYNSSNKSKNRTDHYRFKKHRFIPSPKTEETLRKLKMLIHKYNLSENTFVRRLYESMKKAQKLNGTEATQSSQQDDNTYVPQRRLYKNKYEMARHSKQIMERLRMARDFAQTVQQQTRREKRQLKELTENQNHTLMLMDFLMDQDFPLEVTHEDDYVDFMTELVANAHYLKQPRKKTTTSKPKRRAPSYLQLSSEELSPAPPTKKNVKRNIFYEQEMNLAKDKYFEKEYHPAHFDEMAADNH